MKKKSYAIALLSFAACLFQAHTAPAQMSITVSPLRVEHQVKPGENDTNIIEVRNDGTGPTRIAVHADDWTMNNKGEVSFARAGSDASSCAGWFVLNPSNFRLDPGQARQIRYSLTVPPETKEGGYRAAIALTGMPLPEEGGAKRKMTLNGRIVVMAYATVGNPEIRAQFQDFQVTPGNKGLTFRIRLANQGDVHFRIKKSSIIIKNPQGQEVGAVEVPDVPVLPGAIRELEIKKTDLTLPRGTYVAEAILDVGKEDFLGRKHSFTTGR